ncbi:MAG: asparagine synthase (glutamine-hydrolyzing) [Anaerolineae bacterium]|nr:MAG: asparagine synthase (glutamine-hydrolyzing) [Anaerolineae bacterium]
MTAFQRGSSGLVGEPFESWRVACYAEVMCGICGILNQNGEPVEQAHLKVMADTIAHRGPDGEGYYCDTAMGFGFRRLAIIDLKTGDQPIYSENRQIVTIFNGEIYNYRLLRDELSAAGHVFATQTDTEVLVHGYEQWGLDLVHKLRGMYAFSIWDAEKRRLLLVRDRTGQKPLYYAQWGSTFLFASEIKAILTHPAAHRALNHAALPEYLALGYVLPPRTMFENIYKLAPGCLLTLEPGQNPEVSEYWRPTLQPQNHYSRQENAERVRATLRESVRLHMMSDVPLGTFLSGGVDSTTITALTGQLTGQPVESFTVGFDYTGDAVGDRKFNVDLHYAREAADFLRCHHHEIVLRHENVLASLLPQLVYALDDPIADTAIIQTAFVNALARRSGVPVLLSGDGADEIFAGYPFFQQAHRVQQYQTLFPASIRHTVLHPLMRLLPPNGRLGQLHKLMDKSQLVTPGEHFLTWELNFSFDRIHAMMQASALARTGTNDLLNRINQELNPLPTHDMADKVGYARLRWWLAENSNMRFDKMAMWMSVETRAPFQDHELVDLALSIPLSHKLPGKVVLKDAVKAWIPASVINRPKWGFTPPASDWLRTIFRPLVDAYLLNPNRLSTSGLNPAAVIPLVEAHLNRTSYHLNEVWNLLIFQLWFALYIEQSLEFGERWSELATLF